MMFIPSLYITFCWLECS